jgi:hypothetical protein
MFEVGRSVIGVQTIDLKWHCYCLTLSLRIPSKKFGKPCIPGSTGYSEISLLKFVVGLVLPSIVFSIGNFRVFPSGYECNGENTAVQLFTK